MGKKEFRVAAAVASLLLLSFVTVASRPPQVEVNVPDELGPERCVAHELNTPGQDLYLSGSTLYLSGSTGGMVRGSITFQDPDLVHPNTTLVPLTVDKAIARAGRPATRPFLRDQVMATDVVIVVADDFSGGRYRLPAQLEDPVAATTTLAEIDGLIAAGELSHGALVMHHLNVAIASLGGFTVDASALGDGLTVWVQGATGQRLVVVGLDLSQVTGSPLITADDVLTALNDGVRGVVDEAKQVSHPEGVVVNMSWVFLPCKTIEDFLANRNAYRTFEDYLKAIGVDLTNQSLTDVVAQLASVVHPGLEAVLDGEGRVPDFGVPGRALVAAAGNFSLPWQMLPAGWDQVVGVAVQAEPRAFPGRYSNVGEVTLPGEWNQFEPLTPEGALGAGTLLSYAGTSFAAPIVSLYAALDMASQQPVCQHAPPAEPRLSAGTDLDVRLVDAIDDCN